MCGVGMKQLDALVVGGSLAGLVCAATLAKAGKNIVIIEGSPTTGQLLAPDDMERVSSQVRQLGLLTGSVTQNPISQLVATVEGSRGEIIYDTPVEKLSYSQRLGRWFVSTPWGEISTAILVVAVPLKKAYRLLKPVIGREPWFRAYFGQDNGPGLVPPPTTASHALHIADAYTILSDNGTPADNVQAGHEVANTILGQP